MSLKLPIHRFCPHCGHEQARQEGGRVYTHISHDCPTVPRVSGPPAAPRPHQAAYVDFIDYGTPLRAVILGTLGRNHQAPTYYLRNVVSRQMNAALTTAQVRRQLRRMETEGLVVTAGMSSNSVIWRLAPKT